MKAHGRQHDPAAVDRLVREGRVLTTKRVVSWLANHGYDAAALITGVLGRIDCGAVWLGSCLLANDETADEYVVELGNEVWYVKFYVDDEQMTVVVWSCWWQGTAH